MSIEKTFHSYRIRSEEEKRSIVRTSLLSGVQKKELMRKHGITSYSVLYRWINKYGNDILAETLDVPAMKKRKEDVPTSEEDQLRRRIEELEAALKDARLKAAVYEKMIEIAEEELNVPIRKKPGPQQLRGSKKKRK